jgi:putative toxin-antitoxin system antitoxin component (TIGR02293 family)
LKYPSTLPCVHHYNVQTKRFKKIVFDQKNGVKTGQGEKDGKKLHRFGKTVNLMAKNKQSRVNVIDNVYANEHMQTGTLDAPSPAAPPRSPAAKKKPAANKQPDPPFNFEALTSQYKIGIVRNGISKKQLEAIKSETDLDYRTLSSLLSVSRTTLLSKKGDDKFDQPTSERIMLLAELLSYGREVFESKELFNRWIRKESLALGGKSPLEMLDTLYGIEEVKKELGRIAYRAC